MAKSYVNQIYIKKIFLTINFFFRNSGQICRENSLRDNFECHVSLEEIDLNDYWLGLVQQLPLFSKIAISSCSVKRSFSMYNSLLDSDRQNLSLDSLKKLNMVNV